jgi:peptidoglycan/LPS O-acetylase OafA/YrhL
MIKAEKKIENNQTEIYYSEQRQHLKYRPELDGLRSIAILSVVFYHAGFTLLRGGFVGVDVFFVMSGYLMTTIIKNETESSVFTLKRFYERRARRIPPMLFFTLLVSYIPAQKYMIGKEFLFFSKSAFYSSIGISNILYSSTTRGYFDTTSHLLPLVHTWTLGVEEQFYVIIPLLFIVFWRFRKTAVFGVILTLAFISFYLTFAVMNRIQSFYMLYTRFWELAIGSLIVFLPQQKKS